MKKPINLALNIDDKIYLLIDCHLRVNTNYFMDWKIRSEINNATVPKIGVQLDRQLCDKLTQQVKKDLNK